MDNNNTSKIKDLTELIKKANGTVVLTGAGISTDSGIPDFRGTNGVWKDENIANALRRSMLYNSPKKFYEAYYKIFVDPLQGKEPNEGHKILTQMQLRGTIGTIITQNIDGLHYKSGAKEVIEVHGTIRMDYCTSCGAQMVPLFLRRMVEENTYKPRCTQCEKGFIRPGVVLFEDYVDEFPKASDTVRKNELLICIGTSLSVYPVASLAERCKHLAIINLGPTEYDESADVIINENITKTLEELRKILYT